MIVIPVAHETHHHVSAFDPLENGVSNANAIRNTIQVPSSDRHARRRRCELSGVTVSEPSELGVTGLAAIGTRRGNRA
jgi:hypothetical protein